MAKNILVVDDEIRTIKNLMRNLQRADTDNFIGEIKIDDSIVDDGQIEEFKPTEKFGLDFDIVFIDYQLNRSFTGILVSAWLALSINAPRIALTSAPCLGENYFNGSILKREITDEPQVALEKIKACIREYDHSKWLEEQHTLLVKQYQALLKEPDGSRIEKIEKLLDQFEKILDDRQEEKIKQGRALEAGSKEFLEKIKQNESEIADLNARLKSLIAKVKKDG